MARLIPGVHSHVRHGTSPRSVLTDHQTDLASGHADREHVVGERWTGGARITTTLATVGLWLLIGCGPIALVVALAAVTATQAPSAEPAVPVPDIDALAETAAAGREAAEVAQSFVVTWLATPRGAESRLAGYGLDTSGVRLPETPAQVSNAGVAALTEVDTDVWSVRVGADVVWPVPPVDEEPDAEPQPQALPQRQYFQVTIERVGDALAVQALPAPVPHAEVAPTPRLGYSQRLTPDNEIFDTAGGFLRALLTGEADLTRYVAPDAAIVPVTPPPYVGVEVHDVRVDGAAEPQPDGTTVQVLATASAIAAGDQQILVQYPLAMVARDGRWEVAEISAAPLTSATP